MSETLLTIQEAASLSGKSVQTIRRALKSNKLEAKRRKTPQGFNYLITLDSLTSLYKLKNVALEREQGSVKNTPSSEQTQIPTTQFASIDDLKKVEQTLHSLLSVNNKEREKFMAFMKAFQEKFVVLENQMKVLDQPKKKWYHFWKG